jgi:hypothetical protein
MRCKMRKPADMKTRQYVNHLFRINFDELKLLPPFGGAAQSLSNEELLEIVLFGIPKSWNKEMDRQDFDPFREASIAKLVAFCERMESAEDFTPDHQKKAKGSAPNTKYSSKKSKYNNTNGKSSKGDGKWCEYHESDTHDTKECTVLRKLKESGKKNFDKKPSGKNWKGKSDDAKKFTKKELNALVKKTAKKVSKELNTAAKRKTNDDDDESVKSVNVLESEMKEIDEQLKKFDFAAADNAIDC